MIRHNMADSDRELGGLEGAVTQIRDELTNNLAKLSKLDYIMSDLEEDLPREHPKLMTYHIEIKQDLGGTLWDVKLERESAVLARRLAGSCMRTHR